MYLNSFLFMPDVPNSGFVIKTIPLDKEQLRFESKACTVFVFEFYFLI